MFWLEFASILFSMTDFGSSEHSKVIRVYTLSGLSQSMVSIGTGAAM